jgi:tetratricopeptide (TPR) repeat protein
MELSLEIPREWTVKEAAGRRVAVVPGHQGRPDLFLQWSPLILLPDDQRRWVETTLGSEVPAGARLVAGQDRMARTATGWPLRLVEATVVPLEGGEPLEWRLAAFYAFFEHGATALVRATRKERFAGELAALRQILVAGGPDFSGEPAALAPLWDLAATPRAPADALAAGDRAVADAHFATGVSLAAIGREDEAIAAWEAAAAADPEAIDALYNLGLAHYARGDFAAALESWDAARERAPRDFWVARKVIQAQFALERYDEAAATREQLLEIWRTSDDPAVQLADELVFDQFEIEAASPGPDRSVTVHALETLRPRDPRSHAVLCFRVADHGSRGPISVQIETGDGARARGAPYVLSVIDGGNYEALDTSERLPPYPELKRTAAKLIAEALADMDG